jgi:hypothetical protein
VTALNTYGASKNWLPHQLGGLDIVGDCTVVDEVSPDEWELTFTIPKEVIQSGYNYRIFVIVKNDFTGEPV